MELRRDYLRPSTIVRYSIVGLSVAVMYVACLNLLERAQLAPTAVNSALAFIIAVAFQYVAQGAFTFRRPLQDRLQLARFATTVALGFVISTLVVSYLGPRVGLSTFISSLAVVVLLPFFNFAMFIVWVFADKRSGGVQ